jgi:hypothetical protein
MQIQEVKDIETKAELIEPGPSSQKDEDSHSEKADDQINLENSNKGEQDSNSEKAAGSQ